MLVDAERNMELKTLYSRLCENQLSKSDVSEDNMMSLMQSSVHISLQSMKTRDPECLHLLYLLSLLPGGILPRELDVLWKAYKDLAGAELIFKSFRESYLSVGEVEEH